MKRRWALILTVIPLLLSCGDNREDDDGRVPVTVTVPGRQVITSTIVAPCRLESGMEALVSPLNPGRILRVSVSQGDTVMEGDLLVELSTDQQYSGALAASAATIEAARAMEDNARSDMQRAERLMADGAISRTEYDMAVASLAASRANVSRANADYQSARSMEESGRVLSPFDGVVSRVWAREGLLSSGPLVSIINPGVMTAEVLVSECHMDRLSQGLPALFSTEHFPGELFLGEVSSVSSSVDPVSGLVSVKVQMDEDSLGLRSGMTGTMTIGLETSQDAVVLPLRVIERTSPDSWSAYVVKDGAAVRVPLQTGIVAGTSVEVTSGIQPDDSVIVMGHHLVSDGSPVKVVGQ